LVAFKNLHRIVRNYAPDNASCVHATSFKEELVFSAVLQPKEDQGF